MTISTNTTPSRPTSDRGPEAIAFLDVGAAYRELKQPLDDAYRRVMESGCYVLGREVDAFENEFAAFCGTTQCIGVGNGLDALRLILEASGLGPRDEVIVPAHTFVATWLAVHHAGARPVPVEPAPGGYNLDPSRIEKAITRRTRAVIAVHLYGEPANMDAITDVARRHGLRVFEDAAQAHGARYRGRRCGSLADAAAFSFYPAKNLGAFGDGGAVVTSDPALAERVRLLRNYGSRRKYDHVVPGLNSRLDPMQAAFLRVRLRHLDEWNMRRTRAAWRYLEGLTGIGGLAVPVSSRETEPAWHLFVVRHPRRNDLRRHLEQRGIEAALHYPVAPHQSPAFAHGAHRRLPITEALADTVLSLPIGPHLPLGDVARVIDAVREFGEA